MSARNSQMSLQLTVLPRKMPLNSIKTGYGAHTGIFFNLNLLKLSSSRLSTAFPINDHRGRGKGEVPPPAGLESNHNYSLCAVLSTDCALALILHKYLT